MARKGSGGSKIAPTKKDAVRANTAEGKGQVDPLGMDRWDWPVPLKLTKLPCEFCLPQEVLQFKPTDDHLFKYFFKGTPKEVSIRQIFFHTPLKPEEKTWLREFREFCEKEGEDLRGTMIEPLLLRTLYYNKRKFKEKYLEKSWDHVQHQAQWRKEFFPMSDKEADLEKDLDSGLMYWLSRDEGLKPLLVIRLRKMPKGLSPYRFKRLTIFCFEWALRYLFVPGVVETCCVLLDVRGVSIGNFPMSALTDMTTTLTKQYPFRLDRMWILNDSFFVQTAWSIAKQFLTEVQQQKMQFFRHGFDKELLKHYASHQLETEFGGTKEVTAYYPFPLTPGPFTPGSSPNEKAIPHCSRAVDEVTVRGVVWEGEAEAQQTGVLWSPLAPAVFESCGLPVPKSVRNAALDASEKRPVTAPAVTGAKPAKGASMEAQKPTLTEASHTLTANQQPTASFGRKHLEESDEVSFDSQMSRKRLRPQAAVGQASSSESGATHHHHRSGEHRNSVVNETTRRASSAEHKGKDEGRPVKLTRKQSRSSSVGSAASNVTHPMVSSLTSRERLGSEEAVVQAETLKSLNRGQQGLVSSPAEVSAGMACISRKFTVSEAVAPVKAPSDDFPDSPTSTLEGRHRRASSSASSPASTLNEPVLSEVVVDLALRETKTLDEGGCPEENKSGIFRRRVSFGESVGGLDETHEGDDAPIAEVRLPAATEQLSGGYRRQDGEAEDPDARGTSLSRTTLPRLRIPEDSHTAPSSAADAGVGLGSLDAEPTAARSDPQSSRAPSSRRAATDHRVSRVLARSRRKGEDLGERKSKKKDSLESAAVTAAQSSRGRSAVSLPPLAASPTSQGKRKLCWSWRCCKGTKDTYDEEVMVPQQATSAARTEKPQHSLSKD